MGSFPNFSSCLFIVSTYVCHGSGDASSDPVGSSSTMLPIPGDGEVVPDGPALMGGGSFIVIPAGGEV
jgi:hypothetical protein